MDSSAEQLAEGAAVIKVLAAVLERLMSANSKIAEMDPGVITRFHALKPPSIAVLSYLQRIHKYASCSTECFILALIYVDRLIQRNNFLLTELNVHRVVITSIMLAAKFFDDQYFNNAYYAKVGGVPASEMNSLEVEFLFRINFSLHVTPELYNKYHLELVTHAEAVDDTVQGKVAPTPTPLLNGSVGVGGVGGVGGGVGVGVGGGVSNTIPCSPPVTPQCIPNDEPPKVLDRVDEYERKEDYDFECQRQDSYEQQQQQHHLCPGDFEHNETFQHVDFDAPKEDYYQVPEEEHDDYLHVDEEKYQEGVYISYSVGAQPRYDGEHPDGLHEPTTTMQMQQHAQYLQQQKQKPSYNNGYPPAPYSSSHPPTMPCPTTMQVPFPGNGRVSGAVA